MLDVGEDMLAILSHKNAELSAFTPVHGGVAEVVVSLDWRSEHTCTKETNKYKLKQVS